MIDINKIKSKVLERFSDEMDVHCVEQCESSNKLALEYEYAEKRVVLFLTSHQTDGRGQRGRDWEDEKGNSLLFSMGIRSKFSTPQLLPVLAGLDLQNCFGFDHEEGLTLKWPNDLLWDGAKFCGVLSESQTGTDEDNYVIGVGINWTSTPFEGSTTVAEMESEMDCTIDPGDFLCDFLESFLWDLKSLNSEEYRSRIIANWESQSGFIGKTVKFELEDGSLSEQDYTVHSMDIDGFLKVNSGDDELKTLVSERLVIV